MIIVSSFTRIIDSFLLDAKFLRFQLSSTQYQVIQTYELQIYRSIFDHTSLQNMNRKHLKIDNKSGKKQSRTMFCYQ